MSDRAARPAVGETIGAYTLDRLIAHGGMGSVYAATHNRLGRRAAVKILRPELSRDRSVVSRFLTEARIVNDVRHPNIVDIYDFVETSTPRRICCVMELLQGPTLDRAVNAARFTEFQALNVTVQLVSALSAVHRAGVVHRDLKPQNIIVVAPLTTDLSEEPSVKILDFGIAKVQPGTAAHETTVGWVMGTPTYMAPEQVEGAAVSPATDLYALAEILFEMLARRPLFEGGNDALLRYKLLGDAPQVVLPNTVAGGDRVAALVRACVSPSPRARPSMDDFRSAIVDLLDDLKRGDNVGRTAPGHSLRDAPPRGESDTELNLSVDTVTSIAQDVRATDPADTALHLAHTTRPESPQDPSIDATWADDQPAPDKLANVRLAPVRPTTPDVSVPEPMNTQMFLNRIQEDIADLTAAPNAAPHASFGEGRLPGPTLPTSQPNVAPNVPIVEGRPPGPTLPTSQPAAAPLHPMSPLRTEEQSGLELAVDFQHQAQPSRRRPANRHLARAVFEHRARERQRTLRLIVLIIVLCTIGLVWSQRERIRRLFGDRGHRPDQSALNASSENPRLTAPMR